MAAHMQRQTAINRMLLNLLCIWAFLIAYWHGDRMD